MNKKNWYTVILDGSVSLKELQRKPDEGYLPAIKRTVIYDGKQKV